MIGHVVPKKVYLLVFGSLIALTALTTAAAFLNLDRVLGVHGLPLNTLVALAIAVSKASLVVLFFMHVRYSSHLIRVAVVAGLFWLAILIGLTLSDVFTRDWTPVSQSWQTSQGLPYH
jgi:cytochrome c oxidase subunit 4